MLNHGDNFIFSFLFACILMPSSDSSLPPSGFAS